MMMKEEDEAVEKLPEREMSRERVCVSAKDVCDTQK